MSTPGVDNKQYVGILSTRVYTLHHCHPWPRQQDVCHLQQVFLLSVDLVTIKSPSIIYVRASLLSYSSSSSSFLSPSSSSSPSINMVNFHANCSISVNQNRLKNLQRDCVFLQRRVSKHWRPEDKVAFFPLKCWWDFKILIKNRMD